MYFPIQFKSSMGNLLKEFYSKLHSKRNKFKMKIKNKDLKNKYKLHKIKCTLAKEVIIPCVN